ncbi:MAG: efflux RND transporter permease subunit [Methyloligellaceae bacterium]
MNTLFFRNKRIFALSIIMIFSIGLASLTTIGRQEDPTITNIFATIITPYSGADPARVEALVTEKIEQELRQIPEIKKIDSVSRTGISVINIELSSFISNEKIEQIWSEIRDALSDAAKNFPSGVPEPVFDNDRNGTFTTISALTPKKGTTLNPAILGRYAKLLQDRLRGVSGTKQVDLYGAREEEILVEIDPRKLISLGLTANQVSSAIKQADTKVRSGQVRGKVTNLLIEVKGEITTTERIGSIPVLRSADGRIVRVSDIAVVKKTLKAPPADITYTDGIPAVLIAAKMEDDLQVDAWVARAKKVYAQFEKDIPEGLEHKLLFDQSYYTTDRLVTVMQNMLIGIALVVFVLFVTLGWRAALIVATVLPLASLMSVAGLHFIGISIHQMSVTGLIVALGLLVDAAIVMTDEIRKSLEKGMQRLEAVKEAVSRLTVPLMASTITTALAFTPMMLLPGPAGDFVGAIAFSVVIMLFSSFFLSLTITPALSGWFLSGGENAKNARWYTNGMKSTVFGKVFGKSLELSLAHPRLAILGALVLPIIGFASFPTLQKQFFPGVDRDQFYVQVTLPSGSSIAETDKIAKKADQIIRATRDIKNVNWVIGRNAPAFYYNMIRDRDGAPNFAEALITTTSAQATEEIIPELQRTLDKSLPGASVMVRGLVQGPPVNAPVEIRIVGPDIATLRKLGDQIRVIALQVPDVIQARTQLTGGAPKVIADLNEEKVRLAGLDLGSVALQLETTLEGITGGSLIEGSEELPIRVRVGTRERNSIDSLRRLDVVSPDAQQRAQTGVYPGIPLAALGDIKLQPAETPIFRKDGERINTVQAFVHRNILPEEALGKVIALVNDKQNNFSLPQGYRIELGGDADARAEVMRNLLGPMGIIIALTLATIVLTFNSFRLSAITMTVAVLSIALSILALAICRYPFGITAVIGVIGSIGVSINAAIIIMTALQQDPDALAGDVKRIREIVMAQSRHIISTTITTFGGFLPLIMAGGGFWPPFAMSIAGGVLFSTVVSFYFTPPAFLLLMRKTSKNQVEEEPAKVILPQPVREMHAL